MLGCIYKAFKQINEFKEVIRSLATGPNVGNKKSAKEKKKDTQEHLGFFYIIHAIWIKEAAFSLYFRWVSKDGHIFC